jgi:hypothetical protein
LPTSLLALCCWQGADDIIIVEGELDKLAIEEALLQLLQQQQQDYADGASVQLTADNHWLLNGRRVAVLSVPAGAPALTTKEAKFKYVSEHMSICSEALWCLGPRFDAATLEWTITSNAGIYPTPLIQPSMLVHCGVLLLLLLPGARLL